MEFDNSNLSIVFEIIENYAESKEDDEPLLPTKTKPLLVLDLDETLIHSKKTPDKDPPATELKQFGFFVYYRPFLEYFLHSVSDYYDIGIWSSGKLSYVSAAVNKIMPKGVKPIFVYGRNKCNVKTVNGKPVYVKPLRWLEDHGYPIDKMIIVDDSPEKCVDNIENAIIPKKFKCQKYDSELLDLLHYLKSIHHEDNFRALYHENWKS